MSWSSELCCWSARVTRPVLPSTGWHFRCFVCWKTQKRRYCQHHFDARAEHTQSTTHYNVYLSWLPLSSGSISVCGSEGHGFKSHQSNMGLAVVHRGWNKTYSSDNRCIFKFFPECLLWTAFSKRKGKTVPLFECSIRESLDSNVLISFVFLGQHWGCRVSKTGWKTRDSVQIGIVVSVPEDSEGCVIY